MVAVKYFPQGPGVLLIIFRVKHVDKRVIGKNGDGHLIYSRDYTNTSYHPSMPHMKRQNPLFTGVVYIAANLYNSLDARYRQVLESSQFNVIIK